MKAERTTLGLLLGVWLLTGTAYAGGQSLMTPQVERALKQAHLFKSGTEEKLWARYNLVVRDQDLFGLQEEEASALLLAAFQSAPDRDRYESAWLNLLSISGGDTVFGKIHGQRDGPPVTDLSMFETNRSLLRVSLKLKKNLVKELDTIISEMLDLFRKKLHKGPGPEDRRPDGEMEL